MINFIQKNEFIVWTFKDMYSWKKYQNCIFTINRIGDEFKREYVHRMSKEFKRAYSQGEFSQETFSPLEWSRLTIIMDNPDDYYTLYVLNSGNGDAKKLQKELSSAKRELNDIKGSTTYKVGRAIMKVPCAIKRRVKRNK